MIQSGVTESVVEDAALAWLESLGYTVKHGPEIAPGELVAERVESGTLAASRDALLPKLLSGDVLVKDREQSLERTV
jgi:type I restriction enzyme, R subunit